jgi:hypothetical protein
MSAPKKSKTRRLPLARLQSVHVYMHRTRSASRYALRLTGKVETHSGVLRGGYEPGVRAICTRRVTARRNGRVVAFKVGLAQPPLVVGACTAWTVVEEWGAGVWSTAKSRVRSQRAHRAACQADTDASASSRDLAMCCGLTRPGSRPASCRDVCVGKVAWEAQRGAGVGFGRVRAALRVGRRCHQCWRRGWGACAAGEGAEERWEGRGRQATPRPRNGG